MRVSLFTLWVPTLHTEGLQQSKVLNLQPASLRLRWVYVSAISVCFWTPRLSLGHPGSFRSAHVLKCMRIGFRTTGQGPIFSGHPVCLWTPRLSLGHPGSFKSVLDLLACVHRLDLGFTSHPKDARHSNE